MQQWLYFEVWRWCFFFAGITPIHFLGYLLVHIIFLCAESQFFMLGTAFYYAVSIKVTITWEIRKFPDKIGRSSDFVFVKACFGNVFMSA
jgi:hypothetical protein